MRKIMRPLSRHSQYLSLMLALVIAIGWFTLAATPVNTPRPQTAASQAKAPRQTSSSSKRKPPKDSTTKDDTSRGYVASIPNIADLRRGVADPDQDGDADLPPRLKG